MSELTIALIGDRKRIHRETHAGSGLGARCMVAYAVSHSNSTTTNNNIGNSRGSMVEQANRMELCLTTLRAYLLGTMIVDMDDPAEEPT